MTRAGVVFPFPLEPGHRGKDVTLIPEGLARRGLDVTLYCPEARGTDWPVPVVAGPLHDPAFWRAQRLDAALVYAFLRFPALVEAVAASGARVVAKGDTTGRVVARVHPRETLAESLFAPETTRGRLLAVPGWLARVGPRHGREAADVRAVVAGAAVTVVETESARRALAEALGDLADRIVVVPNPISAAFAAQPVALERERTVVAVGRWDLPIKGPRLLARSLRRFLADRPDHDAIVVGRGQGSALAGERIVSRPEMPQAELAALLARARIALTTSWSESFSLALHEALALGCSVAGPPIAPVQDAVAAGPFGTASDGRSPAAVAAALSAEAAAWDAGRRDPAAIAAHWRARLDGDRVAAQIAELLAPQGR